MERYTEYIVELYGKGSRKPYSVFRYKLPTGSRPRFTNSAECFDFKLSHIPKVKIRYASNGEFVAEKYIDVYGNGRLRWKRR